MEETHKSGRKNHGHVGDDIRRREDPSRFHVRPAFAMPRQEPHCCGVRDEGGGGNDGNEEWLRFAAEQKPAHDFLECAETKKQLHPPLIRAALSCVVRARFTPKSATA